MYCIYSTQSRCRAQNPAAALKLCTPICILLKQVCTRILRAKTIFYAYTSQHTPRCRTDITNKGAHFFLKYFSFLFFFGILYM